MTIKKLIFLILLLTCCEYLSAAVIKGRVVDNSNEPLIGASLVIAETNAAAVTDYNGEYEFAGIKNGNYHLIVSYFMYKSENIEVSLSGMADVNITLKPEDNQLDEVTITATVKRDTELAMIAAQKNSLVVQSGVSAQQIKMTQDRDASEVIKRVPGISIIDERFVMVRGLSQRYNNVWVNNSAVPSSESDSRAFSFEIIPSSQLDNMQIIKSPAPEYPADFSGGFILINTKDIPSKNSYNISIGGNINDRTHFSDFTYAIGSATDFIGFDNGKRSMNSGMGATLNPIAENGINLLGNGFNNDWKTYTKKPVADLSFSADMARRWIFSQGNALAMLAAVNYSNNYRTSSDMENSLFGAYDVTNDKVNYLRHSVDNQYSNDVKIGAMLNFTYVTSSGASKYELKNIFNQLGKDRYTYRSGFNAQSEREESAEYYYRSRSTYNGQFTGNHSFDASELNWSAGYAYSNNDMPDRRRYVISDAIDNNRLGLANANDISREFTRLDEHITSLNANYKHNLSLAGIKFNIRTGVYGEYRTRKYNSRTFIYNWNTSNNTLPSGFRYFDIPTQLLIDDNYGAERLYLIENVKWSNNYSGNNTLAAGYVGLNIPLKQFNIYAGVRYELNKMELISNTKDYEESPRSHNYDNSDFFPSINTTYVINTKNQLRLSYGRTINRQEFREVSPSVFYDFDLASNVQGNYNLKAAYINNVDLRYEFYPAAGEQVSVSLFYKRFANPIEWTYTVTGGTDLTYSFLNAKGADNYGIELDVRKSLDFIGLKNFSWNFNGALIKSSVEFEAGSKEKNRPMQGQSPYLINTGIFYSCSPLKLNAAILYNRIGKRIVGVGRSLGGSQNDGVNIPHSYEMPRNSIDMSVSKMFGNHVTVKFAVRNILSEKVSFQQIDDVVVATGEKRVEQITRQYNPGRNFNLNVSYNF